MLSISDEIPSQVSSGASAPRAAAAAQVLWAPPTQATAEACGAQEALAELQRGAARSLEESGLREFQAEASGIFGTLREGRNIEAFKVRSVGYKWRLISPMLALRIVVILAVGWGDISMITNWIKQTDTLNTGDLTEIGKIDSENFIS